MPEQLHAIHLRHLHVGYDDIEIDIPYDLQPFPAVRRGKDLKTLVPQELREHDQVIGFIVDNQNRIHCSLTSAT